MRLLNRQAVTPRIWRYNCRMFILHSSNKTENLVEHLASVLKHAPLDSPFSKEVLLIQSQGMERWLSQQLASKFHVWANYEFLFPNRFFRFIAQQIDSRIDDEAFDRSLMLWRLEALIRKLDNAALSPLKQYVSGTNQALKRYQLAQQLAQTFDQYQIMRPDILSSWQNGRLLYDSAMERWQQALWQQLTRGIGQKHRGERWLDVIAKLNNAQGGAFSKQLPERLSIFGVNTMPPLFLDFLQSLSKHCDVHLFLLNPAQTFWADLASKRKQPEIADDSGHPLLASLGQQGREFQSLLFEFTQFDFEPESFETIAKPNNLQQLQNDILNNALSGQPLQKDGSISIHACHSRKREIEVLRDQLLLALEDNPDLELRDIAVMAPDIQPYEPFITAVFNDIQHAIADRSLRLENQTLDTFIRFLELSQSRLGWQMVLDLLGSPDVYPNFGLNEADLELIKHWVQDTNVRWGQSGGHKQELGLPGLNEFTWQAALDRLLMGYAVGHEDTLIDGILPYRKIEGSSADALGGLYGFLELLFQAKTEFKQAKPLKAWGARLYFFSDQLLGSGNLMERQQLNELLLELSDTLSEVHHDPVELQVIIYWLEGMIAERKSSNGFLRGQLTFCSMLPMRTIPFKVIALVGIDEGKFPKIDRKPTFDLISQHFRLGDRSRRADDRYQFLETLLSARQQLIITYIGQSQTTNEKIPPSVVVSELIDVLREYYKLDNLVIHHPLQPFSRAYFDSTSELFSFSQADCDTAKALLSPKTGQVLWWHGVIEPGQEDNVEVVELEDLFRFFQHPQRYFLRRQLNLQLKGINIETQEREPFTIQELNLYGLQQDWIRALLADADIALEKLQAQGLWLPGAGGTIEFEHHQAAMHEFSCQIKGIGIGLPIGDIPVDLKIGQYRLTGTLTNLYLNGSLFFRYANLKGKDFITAWLHHLLINQLGQQATHLISADDRLHFDANLSNEDYLPPLIDIYRRGRRQPDAFFVEAALAYLKQAANLKSKKPPLDAAIDALNKSINLGYELELRKLYGNVADMGMTLSEHFAEQCETLLLPAWLAAHES